MASDNPNQDICDMLKELGKLELDAGVMFKYQIYQKAIKSITEYPTRIQSGAEAKKLKFVGPSIATKIDNFLADQNNNNSGSSTNINKADNSNEQPQATPSNKKEDILKISDCHDRFIGMDKEELFRLSFANIHTIGDLRAKGAKLMSPAQQACLKHFSDLNKAIGVDEVKRYKKAIAKLIKNDDDELAFDLVGACRRAGDAARRFYSIDVLVTDRTIKSTSADCAKQLRKTGKHVAKALRKAGLVTKENIFEVNDQAATAAATTTTTTTSSPSSSSPPSSSHYCHIDVLARLSEESPVRRVSLHFVAKDMRICALFTLTGSEQFVRNTKRQALDHGYLLDMSLGGLRRLGYTNVPGQPIRLTSEPELFEFIDIPFVAPEQRNIEPDEDYPMQM